MVHVLPQATFSKRFKPVIPGSEATPESSRSDPGHPPAGEAGVRMTPRNNNPLFLSHIF